MCSEVSRSYGNGYCGEFSSGPVCFSVSWGHSFVGTGWNVTAYTCCIETVAAFWSRTRRRAAAEKRQRRKRVDANGCEQQGGQETASRN